MPVRVKICGITRAEDAWTAIEAGADALGFMCYPGSPRYLDPDAIRAITDTLPPLIARVGVFVDADFPTVAGTLERAGLDTLQLHGDESPDFCRRFGSARVIKAFRVDSPAALDRMEAYRPLTWLLDSYVAGSHGGTGRTFNWDLARDAVVRGGRVILAGGLNPGNVAGAVLHVRPYGVDVSSGVECAPGRKDPARVRDFIAAAKGSEGGASRSCG
ncbi:MAG: phosphoribosylanthranilate isomerase [Verrucomicrobiae bacterium]|nr:phosphoribosylanthranilate isomerase [Verrucomicrobiae bacterium]